MVNGYLFSDICSQTLILIPVKLEIQQHWRYEKSFTQDLVQIYVPVVKCFTLWFRYIYQLLSVSLYIDPRFYSIISEELVLIATHE